MDFSLISNIAEGAQIAGVGLAIYGARRAYKQWQHEKKVERNNQMRSLIGSLLGDERINKIVLDIDHDRLEKIQGSENEGAAKRPRHPGNGKSLILIPQRHKTLGCFSTRKVRRWLIKSRLVQCGRFRCHRTRGRLRTLLP